MYSPISIFNSISISLLVCQLKSEIIQNCPINCRCDLTRGRVFCHNRGFIRIPKNIPPDTKTLNLQDNQLENSAELDRNQLYIILARYTLVSIFKTPSFSSINQCVIWSRLDCSWCQHNLSDLATLNIETEKW